LPALCDPNPNTYGSAAFGGTAIVGPPAFPTPPAYWRQAFTQTGHQILLQGTRAGETLAEDWKIAWLGLAFPNKQQHITEIRMQIGDRKFGRINLEEMHAYNKPALIFENGYVIDEETAFEIYGYFEGPIPALAGPQGAVQPGIPTVDMNGTDTACLYQRIIMLGAAYYKQSDRALGLVGAAI